MTQQPAKRGNVPTALTQEPVSEAVTKLVRVEVLHAGPTTHPNEHSTQSLLARGLLRVLEPAHPLELRDPLNSASPDPSNASSFAARDHTPTFYRIAQVLRLEIGSTFVSFGLMETSARTLSALGAVFLGLVVGGIAATLVVPHAALASGGCTPYHFREDAVEFSGVPDDFPWYHHGVRTPSPGGMWVYGDDPNTTPPGQPATVCTHTSSILSQTSDGSFIEFGWVSAKVGIPISCNPGPAPDCSIGKCVDSGSGDLSYGDGGPDLFRLKSLDAGDTWTCTVFYPITTVNQYKSFTVYDVTPNNGDFLWTTKFAGNAIGGTASTGWGGKQVDDERRALHE